MSKSLKEYAGVLKQAFSKAYGEKPEDWAMGEAFLNGQGQAVCDFKNEKSGILLQVTEREEKENSVQFSVKRLDAQAASEERINLSIPKSWKMS